MVFHSQLGLEEGAGPLTGLAMWGPVDQILSSVILGVVVKGCHNPKWGVGLRGDGVRKANCLQMGLKSQNKDGWQSYNHILNILGIFVSPCDSCLILGRGETFRIYSDKSFIYMYMKIVNQLL